MTPDPRSEMMATQQASPSPAQRALAETEHQNFAAWCAETLAAVRDVPARGLVVVRRERLLAALRAASGRSTPLDGYFTPSERDWALRVARSHAPTESGPPSSDEEGWDIAWADCSCGRDGEPDTTYLSHLVLAALASARAEGLL